MPESKKPAISKPTDAAQAHTIKNFQCSECGRDYKSGDEFEVENGACLAEDCPGVAGNITSSKFYATLCLGHGGGYVTITAASDDEARKKMFASKYGKQWAFMYSAEEKASCIDRYNLIEKDQLN